MKSNTMVLVKIALTLICMVAAGVSAQELSVGGWTVGNGVYKAVNDGQGLYCLADKPFIADAGSVEAAVTVNRRLANTGWAAVGLMLNAGPSDQWVLSLVEGPGHERYTELTERYHNLLHAQTAGITRLTPVDGGFQGTWEYEKTYRLQLSITHDRVTGEVIDVSTGKAVTRQGWILGDSPAIHEGWAMLHASQFDARFVNVNVKVPAFSASSGMRKYSQGKRGCAGLYLGSDMPGVEKAPNITELKRMLNGAGLSVATLTSRDMSDTRALTFPGLRYLLADLRRVPVGSLAPLKRWMQQGGVLISLGAPAFGSVFGCGKEGWIPWDQYSQEKLNALGKNARPILTWSPDELSRWHEILGGNAKQPAKKDIEGSAPDGKPASVFVVPHFQGGYWAVDRSLDSSQSRPGDQLISFWAKGDDKTPEFSLEIREKDGSRWVAVIMLTSKWQHYVLPPQAFAYWRDNPSKDRGGPGDLVQIENTSMLQWGLSSTHTLSVIASADATEHHFSIGTISLATAPQMMLTDLGPVARPDLESISPGYKLFEMKGAARWEPASIGKLWGISDKMPAIPAYGAIERPSGEGFGRDHWCRWIPLVQAVDVSGKNLGAAVSLVLNNVIPFPGSVWLSLGTVRSSDLERPEIQNVIAKTLDRLSSGPLLFEGGADRFLAYTGESVTVGARVVNYGSAKSNVQVVIRVIKADGKTAVPEIRLPVTSSPKMIAVAKASLASLPAGDYTVVTTLMLQGKAADAVKHPLKVRARLKELSDSEVVRRDGGRLLLDGKPWHPVGLNYWPHNMAGTPPDIYMAGWLNTASYQPDVVEADLAQMESWGCNSIAGIGAQINWGTGDDTLPLRNLLDFLYRCQKHHIKVILFVKGLDPAAGRDDEGALRVIRAVRFHPAILGYDIAWEPGYNDQRFKYAQQWRDWLLQHYGSFDRAETMFEYKLPRDGEGNVSPALSEWLTSDGPWRRVSAAYRAFMEYQLGIDYRYSAALIRKADPSHLVGFRGAAPVVDFMPIEQPSVLHFMDWAGPEGYDVPAYGKLSPKSWIDGLGLATRMLSYISGGKPVVWMEFGMPIYPNGTKWKDEMLHFTPEQYKYQSDEGGQFWQMQTDSGAWGSFAWWYPGGYRVDEGSECGFVDANNAPRPVSETAGRMWSLFTGSETRKADAFVDFRPDRNPQGWFGEYMRLRKDYTALVQQGSVVDVHSDAEGVTSENTPLIDPAAQPWQGAGPLYTLNSIFEQICIGTAEGEMQNLVLPNAPGKPVEVVLPRGFAVDIEAWVGNIGEAKWLRDGVVLNIGDKEAPLYADTAFQGSGHFAVTRVTGNLDKPMTFKLQVGVRKKARFGEIVEVNVRPDR